MKATIYLSIVKKTVSSLVVMAMSVAAFGQANSSFLNNSPLIHSYSHGALANRNQFNNNVGASGVIRTQLSWQNAADLDLRFLLPQGVGSYVGSGFETFPIKNTLFLDTPDRHVWAGQKTVVFSNGQAQSSLDVDVRDGIANAPGGYRIENNYLSGNIPSGTYSFAVENYDNSHYYRNNPSAPATNFNIAVTLSGNGYIIPDNTLPLIAETGYAFGATGSIKDVGAIRTSASPIYSFNFFNPGLDSTHASGIDFFKRFNGNFLPGTYLAMLNVPGMNPAQAPSMVDAMQRMANGQKNQFDSLSVLTNMGEGRLQKEFAKHFATPDSRHNTAQYIDPKTGQAVTVARSDFIRAMWAMNENKALKQQGDAFMASLPEQTRRDFQAIQNLHGNQHTATELRTADNNFLTNGQVANSVNSTVLRALHSQDAQIAKGIFNDMVAYRTTTNAGALFDRKQVMSYDGMLTDVAYIRSSKGNVLALTEGRLDTIAGQANQQIRINREIAAQNAARKADELRQQTLAANQPKVFCANASNTASVECSAAGAVPYQSYMVASNEYMTLDKFERLKNSPTITDPNYKGAMSGYGSLDAGLQAQIPNPDYVRPIYEPSNLTAYQKWSLGIHTTLGAAGGFPVLGAIPDTVDFFYTAGEIPFGQSTLLDLGMATGGLGATLLPIGGDQGMAALKISTRTARVMGKTGGELVELGKDANKIAPLQDSDLICRGGICTSERFTNGNGVTLDINGRLKGVSVNSGNGKTVQQLSSSIPNAQIGVTTVGDVRKLGGDVIPSPTKNNKDHCTLCGITPSEAENLMTPTFSNPNTN